MALYMRELVKVLDKEDPGWRRSTVILHDGASYCKEPMFIEVLRDLHIPWMASSPHSYNTSWVELLFGAIKTGMLAPIDTATGRR